MIIFWILPHDSYSPHGSHLPCFASGYSNPTVLSCLSLSLQGLSRQHANGTWPRRRRNWQGHQSTAVATEKKKHNHWPLIINSGWWFQPLIIPKIWENKECCKPPIRYEQQKDMMITINRKQWITMELNMIIIFYGEFQVDGWDHPHSIWLYLAIGGPPSMALPILFC